jgi:hypothetical protein
MFNRGDKLAATKSVGTLQVGQMHIGDDEGATGCLYFHGVGYSFIVRRSRWKTGDA